LCQYNKVCGGNQREMPRLCFATSYTCANTAGVFSRTAFGLKAGAASELYKKCAYFGCTNCRISKMNLFYTVLCLHCRGTLCMPWTGGEGSTGVEAPRFEDNRHMKVVKLPAQRTGRLYLRRKYSWCSFLLEAGSIPGP
jgi:hypothetical protein